MASAPTENGKKVLTMGLDIIIKELKEFRCPDCGAKMDGGAEDA